MLGCADFFLVDADGVVLQSAPCFPFGGADGRMLCQQVGDAYSCFQGGSGDGEGGYFRGDGLEFDTFGSWDNEF